MIKITLVGPGHKWAWAVWSKWNELIFCMQGEIHIEKLFFGLLGECFLKWRGHLVHETIKSAASKEWAYELS